MADRSSAVKAMRGVACSPHGSNSCLAIVLRRSRLRATVASYAAASISTADAAPGPTAKDEPHPTLMRTLAAPLRRTRRLCQEQCPGRSRYAFVPGPVAIQERRAHLLGRRGQLGSAHGRGGSSGVSSFWGAAAGVGWTWDGASAPSPS